MRTALAWSMFGSAVNSISSWPDLLFLWLLGGWAGDDFGVGGMFVRGLS